MRCRGYSARLKKAVADFGADNAFGQVNSKLKEHYGITLSDSAACNITREIAHALTESDMTPEKNETAAEQLIGQTDGSMIPIVETGNPSGETGDKRKMRKLFWKEARLTSVRRVGEVSGVFAVTVGEAALAGNALSRLAESVGFTSNTKVHGVGDGATWIAEQFSNTFGDQSSYLIDFYHLCEYISPVASVCSTDKNIWMEQQKQVIKAGKVQDFVQLIKPHLEPEGTPDAQAPVYCCSRYITNRPGQFEYHQAIANNLPIGSGEIESAHRYVIQKRMKLPGAWWLMDNAKAMLNLRAMRANKLWDRYWQ